MSELDLAAQCARARAASSGQGCEDNLHSSNVLRKDRFEIPKKEKWVLTRTIDWRNWYPGYHLSFASSTHSAGGPGLRAVRWAACVLTCRGAPAACELGRTPTTYAGRSAAPRLSSTMLPRCHRASPVAVSSPVGQAHLSGASAGEGLRAGKEKTGCAGGWQRILQLRGYDRLVAAGCTLKGSVALRPSYITRECPLFLLKMTRECPFLPSDITTECPPSLLLIVS